jgi:hypothetical protein
LRHLRRWLSIVPAPIFVLHAILFLVLLAWSWRKWNDPIVDFGRELYVPWQLTQGKMLYRDIGSLFGPLSPYLNALWMGLFGVSLTTLALANAAIFAAIVALVHHFIRIATDRFTATVASLVVLLLCGFCQYTGVANYNFITPYSHEATHGLALGILTVVFLHRALAHSRSLPGAAAGVFFGLSLLTKTEVPVATAAAVAAGLIGNTSVNRGSSQTVMRIAGAFCGGAVLGPAVFFAYFRQYVGTSAAVRDVATAWVVVWDPNVTGNPFYRLASGTDHPFRNAGLMLLMTAGVLALIGVSIALTSTASRKGYWAAELQHLGTIAIVAIVPATQLLPLGRILPLVTSAACVAAVMALRKHRRDRETTIRHLALVMWSVFATAMLGKIVLRSSISHYGFYLALPAVTVAVIWLCTLIPEVLEKARPGRAGHRFRFLAAFAIAVGIVPHLTFAHHFYAAKTETIGEGNDRFYVSGSTGLPFRDAVTALRRILKRGETVAVVPEGVMLNYLLRAESPLHVVTLMPPEVVTFGEPAIVDSLRTAPPTYVVFVHKNTSEYGYPVFGLSPAYGGRTMDWIKTHYQLVQTMGNEPLTSDGQGVAIFRIATPHLVNRARSIRHEKVLSPEDLQRQRSERALGLELADEHLNGHKCFAGIWSRASLKHASRADQDGVDVDDPFVRFTRTNNIITAGDEERQDVRHDDRSLPRCITAAICIDGITNRRLHDAGTLCSAVWTASVAATSSCR